MLNIDRSPAIRGDHRFTIPTFSLVLGVDHKACMNVECNKNEALCWGCGRLFRAQVMVCALEYMNGYVIRVLQL
jgi:hypothetical protein